MIIEHENWSPAIEMFSEMITFDANIKEIQQECNDIPNFNENFGRNAEPTHLTLEEIRERKNMLIRLQAKVESTLKILGSVAEAYHQYQEMYFENT